MRKIVSSVIMSAALTLGVAHAQPMLVTYGQYSFSVPESWGVMQTGSDCSLPASYFTVDTHYCSMGLPVKSYFTPDYEKILTIIPGSALRGMTEQMQEEIEHLEPANFTNFVKLLRGDVALEDFYDDGVLIDEDHRVFDLFPIVMVGSGMSLIRDITPIEVNEKLVGYAFTPAIAGLDWPPLFSFRMTILYLEQYDLIVGLQENLSLPEDVQSIYQYLEEYGEKDAEGEIDYTYYDDRRTLLDILNAHFDAEYLERMPTYPEDFSEDLQELYLKPIAPFSDVGVRGSFADAITYAKMMGAVGGYPDGTFRPTALINRAEFMKILLGALGEDRLRPYEGQQCFRDVDPDAWYAKYVCAGKATNLVSGYPDGTFGVEKNINLVEALKILLGTLQLADSTKIIPQYTSDWYSGYLETAKYNGLLKRTRILPGTTITRGEMAEIIYKLDSVFEVYEIPSQEEFLDLQAKG